MKIKLFYVVSDSGDGSAGTFFFSSREKWNAFMKPLENDGTLLDDGSLELDVSGDGSFTGPIDDDPWET